MLDKSIESGKDRRKPHRGAKAIDCTCLNHGSCHWCRNNRLHKKQKGQDAADDAIKDNQGD